MRRSVLFAIAIVTSLVACARYEIRGAEHPDAQAALLQRASFDFDCPQGALHVVPLGGACADDSWSFCTKGVSGCGRHAVYVYSPGRDPGWGGFVPGWTLDGVVTTSPAGAPPPLAAPAPARDGGVVF